ATLRLHHRTRRSFGPAPARRIIARVHHGGMASTNPWMRARPGHTWASKDTHHIGRIVIHPSDPNIVYVAAVGHLWGPSKERGVYKSTDGGKSWNNVLFINEDTGVTDVAMDHQSPGTLIAAAYQRRRTVFGFNGSGPGGGLYKTTDGGATWKKLEKGLPWDSNPPARVAAVTAETAVSPQDAETTMKEIGRIGVS